MPNKITKITTPDNTEYDIVDDKAYHTDDSTSTDIADGDYIPLSSASAKKKSTFSNFVAKIKAKLITDTYSGTSTTGMSGKAVKSAIDALDGNLNNTTPSASKTLTAFSQTDGKVSATFGDINISKSQINDFPTIPTVNDASLTINQNGTLKGEFTANDSDDVTVNLTDENVKQTADTTTSWRRLALVENNNTEKSSNVFKNSSFWCCTSPIGTTSTVGKSFLAIGNNTSSGTDGNSKGYLRIYGENNKRSQITINGSVTADREVYLPNKDGTIALTDDIPSTYAGSSTAGGAATSAVTAEKLSNTSKIGDTNKPVYFKADGTPAAISYTIGKNVPSDAVFTDTTYSFADGTNQFTVTPSDTGTASTVKVTPQLKIDGITSDTTDKEINCYGECSTAAGTAAKVVSITKGTFALGAGAKVIVKFTNANTANNPTLNVNSNGAKNIFHNGARITTSTNKALLAGVVEFVYDGTQFNLVGNYINTEYTAASSAPGKVASSSSTGSSTNYARQDHTHGIDLATGDANGQVKIAGTNVDVRGLGSRAYDSTNYLPLSGGTLIGNLLLKKTSSQTDPDTDDPAQLMLRTTYTPSGGSAVNSSATIRAYSDRGNGSGANLVIQPGGNLFIGSGESPEAHYALYKNSGSERTFITADSDVNIQANGNNPIGNRKGLKIQTDGSLVPNVADTATNNAGSIGTSAYKWANVYATNLNGVAIGDSPEFTDTTYTFTGGTNKFSVSVNGGTPTDVTITPSISNNITGSGTRTNGYLAKFSATNTITNGPQIGSDTTKFLRNDGSWEVPYELPLATSSVRGGVKIGYTQSGKNYPVQLSSEKMYVNVPWTDTDKRKGFFGTCSTAAGTATKVVTLNNTDGWELKAGVIVGVNFTNSNSAAAPIKLNVNGSGAISISYNGNTEHTGNQTNITGLAGHTIYYMYNGTYWAFINCTANWRDTNTTYSAGTGLSLSGNEFSNSGVIGVKGNAESSYRTGQVNLTPTNIGALALSGGTLTGDVYYRRANIDVTQSNNGVTSAQYPRFKEIQDANGVRIINLEAQIHPNGKVGSYWNIRNYNGSTSAIATKGIKMLMDKSGNLDYTISDADNFRTAIGISGTDTDFNHYLSQNDNDKIGTRNLLFYPFNETTKTTSGVTFTDNYDGSVTVNGTATEDVTFYFCRRGNSRWQLLLPKGMYALTGCPSGGSSNTYRMYLNTYRQGSTSSAGGIEDTGSGGYQLFLYDITVGCYIEIKKNTVCNNLIFKPMLYLNNFTANTDYIDYAQTNRQLTISKADYRDIATVENTNKASKAYVKNDLIIWRGDLHRVTTNISSGGTITLNTNVVATTLSAEIKAIRNALNI